MARAAHLTMAFHYTGCYTMQWLLQLISQWRSIRRDVTRCNGSCSSSHNGVPLHGMLHDAMAPAAHLTVAFHQTGCYTMQWLLQLISQWRSITRDVTRCNGSCSSSHSGVPSHGMLRAAMAPAAHLTVAFHHTGCYALQWLLQLI